VDDFSTVESILQQGVYKEKFFSKEPDRELYWLFKCSQKADLFDLPLPKDKRILKLIYKQEKERSPFLDMASQQLDGQRFSIRYTTNPDSPEQKHHSTYARKHTVVATSDAMPITENVNLIFYVKKRIFTSLHWQKNFRVLSRKSQNFLY